MYNRVGNRTRGLALCYLLVMITMNLEAQTDRFKRAQKAFDRDEFHKSLALLKHFPADESTEYAVSLLTTSNYLAIEEYDSAASTLEQTSGFPKATSDPEFIRLKAIHQWLTRKEDEAIQSIGKSIELGGTKYQYYLDRGLMHYYMANFKNACEDLKRSRELGCPYFKKSHFKSPCGDQIGEALSNRVVTLPYVYGRLKLRYMEQNVWLPIR